MKNKYFEKNSSGTDLSVLDYENNSETRNLENVLSAQGLFSSKQLIIVKNILTKGLLERQKAILEFLEKNSDLEKDTDLIVIFFEDGSPKKNLSLFKFLVAHSKKQAFLPLNGVQLTNWALNYAKSLSPKTQFSRTALNLLLLETGNNLFALSNEIAKLVNYTDGKIIDDSDVAALVKSKVDSTMFETIEALASGNKKHALSLFHEQIAKGEDVFYILSMYIYQIRTLLKIGDFYWQGQTNTQQIAKAANLHPYVVQKSLSQVRNLSEEKTKQMLRDLSRIDQNTKTGKIDPILALDTFIVSI